MEETKFNLIPYAGHIGSPKIEPVDTSHFINKSLQKFNHHSETKFNELKKEFEDFFEQFELNKLIYSTELRFEPIVGEVYHLYENQEKRFLSLIEPNMWKEPYICSVKLNSDGIWEKVK
jgi:hypothetical protein